MHAMLICSEPPSEPLVPCNLYGFSSTSSALILVLFLVPRHFFRLRNADTAPSVLRFAHCLLLALLIYWQGMWNITAVSTLWCTSAQRYNQSQTVYSSLIPSNNQFCNTQLNGSIARTVYKCIIKWN